MHPLHCIHFSVWGAKQARATRPTLVSASLLMKTLRFAVFGAGFWARYQLAAWREVGGVECVAVYNRTRSKAADLARDCHIPAVYDDAEKLLREVKPDFVDNITEVGGHKPLSLLCARHGIPCICQKPMAASLQDARAMVHAFR